jgi:hypothetical protein
MDFENKFLFLQHPFGLNYVLDESLFWSSFLIFEIKFELINGPKRSKIVSLCATSHLNYFGRDPMFEKLCWHNVWIIHLKHPL